MANAAGNEDVEEGATEERNENVQSIGESVKENVLQHSPETESDQVNKAADEEVVGKRNYITIEFKKKSAHRSYRPRVIDSSSEEEMSVDEQPQNAKIGGGKEEAARDPELGECSNNVAKRASDNERSSSGMDIDEKNEDGGSGAANTEAAASTQESGSHRRKVLSRLWCTDSDDSDDERERQRRRNRKRASGDGDDDDDADDNDGDSGNDGRNNDTDKNKKIDEAILKDMKIILSKSKPIHRWNLVNELHNREYGSHAKKNTPLLFSQKYYDSLHIPNRLELFGKLEFHSGCVNCLNFNASGDLLASGSDDLHVAIWDWSKKKARITYDSGHRNNVFQCKFLPLSGNSHIVSCGRDGQVRMAELTASGVCHETKRLAKHMGPAHKLAIRPDCPHEFLSAGEDAVVLSIDIRAEQPSRVTLVKDVKSLRVALYSIHAHPMNEHQFCVSGRDQYVRVYDRRIVSPFGPPVIKYCPTLLLEKEPVNYITAAVYSNNGDAILASYSSEDIYLFDTNLSEGAEHIHRYSGHMNSSTVKGVNFFSPNSQYIVSGSDCGNIFIWDRETEAIINCMQGDENGVVNVLEPHPHFPVLATSGLDDDVKVWIPTAQKDPSLPLLEHIVKSNLKHRIHEREDDLIGRDARMLMILFDRIRRGGRRMRRRENEMGENEDEVAMSGGDSASDSNDSDDSDLDSHRGVSCTTQ